MLNLDVMGADVYQNVMEGLRHPNRLSLKPAQEWIFKISQSEKKKLTLSKVKIMHVNFLKN